MAIASQQNKRRFKSLITITAGTPIMVTDKPKFADRILIQMRTGGTGRGYVYDDIPDGMTPAQIAAGGDVPVELAPADSEGPGGVYEDTGNIDLSGIAIDGAVTGDVVLVSAHLKI